MEQARKARKVVLSMFPRASERLEELESAERWRRLNLELIALRPTSVICFGSPLTLADFGQAAALVCSYDDSPALLQATAELCSGRLHPVGRLPVQLKP